MPRTVGSGRKPGIAYPFRDRRLRLRVWICKIMPNLQVDQNQFIYVRVNHMKKWFVSALHTTILVGLTGVTALFGVIGPASAADPAATLPRHLTTDRLIVKYRDPAMAAAMVLSGDQTGRLSAQAGMALGHIRRMEGGAHLLQLPGQLPLDEAKGLAARLQADPAIEYAEPDAIMRHQLTPNDTQYPSQWHYFEPTTEIGGINLPPAWDTSTGSTSVVTAVIDTGLVPHADIDGNILDGTGQVVPGYDFVSLDTFGSCNGQPCTANDGDGRDSDPTDPGDWITSVENAGLDSTGGFFADCGASNSSWHGTHLAGTIGALSNNAAGVAGVSWNSKILPVRVLGKCGGYLSDIADGMRWAAGLSVSGVPANANPAKVLNLSLGGPGSCASTYQGAINAVTAAGATVVAAASNDAADVSGFQPANCNGVIAVAATTRTGAKASYSNFGTGIKIAAPGGSSGSGNGVRSTLNIGTTGPAASPGGDSYVAYQGTSMATSHVSGVVVLMLSVNSSLSPTQVLNTLQSTARTFPTGTGADCTTATCGAGIVNAAAALALASTLPPPPPGNMPLPTGPTPFSCQDGASGVFSSTDPASARPLGAVNASGQLLVQLGTAAFAAPIDIYVVAQLPNGQQLIMNSLKQWLPYPTNTVPYRAGSASALILDTLWQAPLASISPGAYAAYTVIVPAGTNPMTFSLASSSYYLWCATRTLP